MALGFRVGNVIDEIGSPSFMHAFFSTISHHLEPDGWGTTYPELMNELYHGHLDAPHAEKALHDLVKIRDGLKSLPPSAVVWDINDVQARPPWRDNFSKEISDLSTYFVTSTGRDVFDVMVECLETLTADGGTMTIVSV